MLRVATKEDLESIRQLCNELSKASVYSALFEGYLVTDSMIYLYTNPNTLNEKICVIVSEDAVDVGFGAFDIIPWVYNDINLKMARLAYIYVKPEYRNKGYRQEIEMAFEHWGKFVKADWYSQGISKESIKINEEMNLKEYTKFETVYMKKVK